MGKSRIAVFYGSSTGNTKMVADKIAENFQGAHKVNVECANKNDLEAFDFLIFGVPTWGIGDMQHDWENFMKTLQKANLTDKVVAIFGLGDQKNYPDNFVDGMGLLYENIMNKVKVIGHWSCKGYDFKHSKALKNDFFVGLAIDCQNQQHLTQTRINDWVLQIKGELEASKLAHANEFF
jgi:flavodoxin I